MDKAITEKTRQWVAGADVEPDPTCYAIGSAYMQNIRCGCGKRFVTDSGGMLHALRCPKADCMEYQGDDGVWRQA